MNIDKKIDRKIEEKTDGVIVTEVETRVVTLSDDELLKLNDKWVKKLEQIDIESSDAVKSHLTQERELLNNLGNSLTPFFKQDTNNVPPNLLGIHNAINDLVMSYAERVRQIEDTLKPEHYKQMQDAKEEFKKSIEDFKAVVNKAKLKKKVAEKKEERRAK